MSQLLGYMIPSRSCGLSLQHEAGRTCDAWPLPSPEEPVAALDAEGSATRGHPPSRSWVLGNSRHGLRDPVLRQVQEDHPVRASHHPPGRQVASDLGTLGTLGTSLGRAGRIRQLLGALGAVLERVVRMWRDPPKGRSSPGSTGSNHAHDETRAKSRRHLGLQPGPLVADANGALIHEVLGELRFAKRCRGKRKSPACEAVASGSMLKIALVAPVVERHERA